MGRWIKARKKRREWRLEEKKVWGEVDKEAEQREEAGEEDEDPDDTEQEEENYMQALFEMRRLAYIESTKDPNDIY